MHAEDDKLMRNGLDDTVKIIDWKSMMKLYYVHVFQFVLGNAMKIYWNDDEYLKEKLPCSKASFPLRT